MDKYELMHILEVDKSSRSPDGIDEEPEITGNAKDIIVWLLHHDKEVKEYKLAKKRSQKPRRV